MTYVLDEQNSLSLNWTFRWFLWIRHSNQSVSAICACTFFPPTPEGSISFVRDKCQSICQFQTFAIYRHSATKDTLLLFFPPSMLLVFRNLFERTFMRISLKDAHIFWETYMHPQLMHIPEPSDFQFDWKLLLLPSSSQWCSVPFRSVSHSDISAWKLMTHTDTKILRRVQNKLEIDSKSFEM